MAEWLVVIHPFGPYKVGDVVVEKAEMAGIGQGEHANRAVRVLSPAVSDDQSEDN